MRSETEISRIYVFDKAGRPLRWVKTGDGLGHFVPCEAHTQVPEEALKQLRVVPVVSP